MNPPAVPEGERIAKAIARAGIASRRDAEALIEAGRVTLNGKVLTSPAINVTDSDRITVDDEPLPARERTRLWLLHKPRGVVTTARDPEGRPTVFDGLPEELPRVVAIGRLDINTEGLLLLTNDGGLAKVIAHPDTGWLRRYRVRAFGDVTQPDLDKLKKGLTVDGMEYGPIEATLDRAQGDNVWLTLGLREGKNREVKRILEHLGLSVNRLIRLSFGPFQLGDLEVGLVEEIRTKVLKEQLGKNLAEQAGVDFESPVRETIAPFGSPKKATRAAQPAAPAGRGRQGARDEGSSEARSGSRGGSSGRPPRDPARPAAPRAGARPAPRPPSPTVWRADEETRPRASKVPRRGMDPKTARAAAAERGRERVGAIQAAGERRVLVERLQPSPETPAPEPHRRVRFRSEEERSAPRDRAREDGPRQDRPRQDRPRQDRPREDRPREDRPRSEGPRENRTRDERPGRDEFRRGAPAGDARPRRREDGEAAPAERRGPPRERPSDFEGRPPRERSEGRPQRDFHERGEGAPRRERPSEGRPPERRGPPRDRPRAAEGERPARPPRGAEASDRPAFRKGPGKGPGGGAGKSFGGKPGFKGGDRDGARGDFKGGAKGGPRGDFKPGGGGRPGGRLGGRPGGKPGGAPGGRPGGGKPGPRGGGRPSRPPRGDA
ncbi:23S rRNA pseudouridine2605 synthase [Methylorubrum zatmanii]|nr:23S rRNA pseudouridine2605 synthase [Methylorubrum zatmanii]MCP1553695.1 23S rRNA pseudouridine2605 synthase [Methylorubrum extorquens]MCP1579993.1 23S rRNA pseudouridine2605 synthase [Methylorubrum extorquens]